MKSVQVVAAWIEGTSSEGKPQVLIFRRSPNVRNPGEWEFPGGKVEESESKEAALSRELFEELKLKVKIHSSLGEEKFSIQDRDMTLTIFRCQILDDSDLQLTEHDKMEWVDPMELDLKKLSAPDRPFVLRWLRIMKLK